MKKQYLIYLVMAALLAACGSDDGNKSLPGAGSEVSPDFYNQFKMAEKSDCAGERRSYTYVEGSVDIADKQIILSLKIAESGVYAARVAQNNSEVKSIEGTWRLQNSKMVFDGLGAATGELFINVKPILRFTFSKNPLSTPLAGKQILLVKKLKDNESGVKQCSPADNPKMESGPGGIKIDGETPEIFWPKLFSLGAGTNRERVGERGGARSQLRILPSGTYLYIESKEFEEVVRMEGVWSYRDGLLVLEGLGFAVPKPHWPTGVLYPLLYLTHDPATKMKNQGRYPAVALESYGG